MDIGDKVIFYTHEASDADHRTIDQLAFVVGIVDDLTIDVVIFPPGGPVRFERVSAFDPEAPLDAVGLNYWRPVGEDPPDFSGYFAHMNDPRWIELRNRQGHEFRRTLAKHHAELRERHKAEQIELDKELSEEKGSVEEENPNA